MSIGVNEIEERARRYDAQQAWIAAEVERKRREDAADKKRVADARAAATARLDAQIAARKTAAEEAERARLQAKVKRTAAANWKAAGGNPAEFEGKWPKIWADYLDAKARGVDSELDHPALPAGWSVYRPRL